MIHLKLNFGLHRFLWTYFLCKIVSIKSIDSSSCLFGVIILVVCIYFKHENLLTSPRLYCESTRHTYLSGGLSPSIIDRRGRSLPPACVICITCLVQQNTRATSYSTGKATETTRNTYKLVGCSITEY